MRKGLLDQIVFRLASTIRANPWFSGLALLSGALLVGFSDPDLLGPTHWPNTSGLFIAILATAALCLVAITLRHQHR
jgi:hypothetical protein